MLSGLAVSAMLTALIAGITGAWSPCGFSMVDTIGTALGNPRRSATLTACATFTVGALVGGAVTFGGLAALGGLLGDDAGDLREALGAAIALAAAAADWRGLKIAPQIRRQVPERWRWTMPLPLASGLYGVLLGLGFTTFVLAFAVWALAGISFATGSPLVGLLIGCAFGLGRALPVLWMAPSLRGDRAGQLEDMAAEPRLWLGLRRLDALGLCLCALFLSGSVAVAAELPPPATDPSAAGGDLVWQVLSGPGMLRIQSGQVSALPGTHPALGQSSIAWQSGAEVTVADRTSLTVKATIPAGPLNALAVSDGWIAYREEGTLTDKLIGVSLLAPTQPLEVLAPRPAGEIGRPALDGSTVVFALDTSHRAAIESIDLTTGRRHVLRSARSGAALVNPSLLDGRLLYERIDRCSQELRVGSTMTATRDRVLLRLPSTVQRDPGYQPGYEHAYNSASLCHNRGTGNGGRTRLGSTALSPSTAYVTEMRGNPRDAHIIAISRHGSASASTRGRTMSGRARRGLPRRSTAQVKPAPSTANPTPTTKWQPDVRAAIAYAHTRSGEVSFAVRRGQRRWGWRASRTVPSASVLKAMLLVAYLDDHRVRNRPLTAADHRLIDPMIQRSDNLAATEVLAFVGASGVDGVARRAGMRNFTLDPLIWGLSRIDASDQTRFFLHIDSHVVPRHRATAMHLLATITPSQRWGIGQLRLPGWKLYFKGGWGSGSGAVEHQVALLRHGTTRLSIAVLITASPSHAYAKQTLREVFAALLRRVGELLVAPTNATPLR
jgi:hypothetical protein